MLLAHRLRLATAIAATLSLCFPCVASAADANEKLKVATTFTVIADMARQVGGDAVEVSSITRPGAEIHSYQPTPHDLLAAREAQLILWNGLNLEQWFKKFLANLPQTPSAVVSDGIQIIGIGEGPYSGLPNPHAWMSFEGAKAYVENIRKALSEADPENAALYEENAERYALEIEALGERVRKQLAGLPENRRWLATSEGAFSYLARDLNLRELYIWPINADQQGTPQQVRAVIDSMREHSIPVIFSESTVSPAAAKRIAREAGAKYGGALYVDSLSRADGPVPDFLSLLAYTSGTIADELSGATDER